MECTSGCNGELSRYFNSIFHLTLQVDSDLLNLLYQILSSLEEEDESDRAGIYHVLGKHSLSFPGI